MGEMIKTKGAAKHRAPVWWGLLARKRCAAAAVLAYYRHAAVRVSRRLEVFALHADLHAWTGHNTNQLTNDMGGLLWVVMDAARLQAVLVDGRMAHHIAHAYDVLAMVRARPKRLQALRYRLVDGLTCVQALRQQLQPVWLVEAERRLRWQLRTNGYAGTQDLAALTRARA